MAAEEIREAHERYCELIGEGGAGAVVEQWLEAKDLPAGELSDALDAEVQAALERIGDGECSVPGGMVGLGFALFRLGYSVAEARASKMFPDPGGS